MSPKHTSDPSWPRWRRKLHDVIFEADTPAGKAFDVALLLAIVASVVETALDSVESIHLAYGPLLNTVEWVFTGLFTLEYLLRLICVRNRWGYATSFFGVVDLLAVLPSYLSLLDLGWRHAVMVRSLRLLRVFRIFKLAQFLSEAKALRAALAASRAKITVFLTTVIIMICIVGSVMYLVEGPASGFTSIPRGIYWAVVTVTTVGYGDLTPTTPLGQVLATLVMLLGYSILVIPGGIISSEWSRARDAHGTQACPDCSREGHDLDAAWCKYCGGRL